jgi:Bromodomain
LRSFQLSLFENDKCEFAIPEMLYTSRLTALERTLVDRDFSFESLDIHLYYCDPDVNEEDQEMQLYPAVVKSLGEEEAQSNPHLRGSGFGVLNVDCEEYDDNFSPWEVMVDQATPGRPGLSEEDMKVVADALRKQMRKPAVREFYSKPVDTERYYDYLNMVEIPMDLSFIHRRFHSDYYATKLSVVADIKLIHHNSVKYNGNVGQLQEIAAAMHEEFEQQVLTEEERGQARVQSPPALRFRVGTSRYATNLQQQLRDIRQSREDSTKFRP